MVAWVFGILLQNDRYGNISTRMGSCLQPNYLAIRLYCEHSINVIINIIIIIS